MSGRGQIVEAPSLRLSQLEPNLGSVINITVGLFIFWQFFRENAILIHSLSALISNLNYMCHIGQKVPEFIKNVS